MLCEPVSLRVTTGHINASLWFNTTSERTQNLHSFTEIQYERKNGDVSQSFLLVVLKYALHKYIMYILRIVKHTTTYNGPVGSMS
jgi:hypothetical protein